MEYVPGWRVRLLPTWALLLNDQALTNIRVGPSHMWVLWAAVVMF
nr:MAG TPA: hypothetical protein [Caudoviricetes sp.]